MEEKVLDTLAKNWGALFLRGLVAILFAIAAWGRPTATLAVLVILIGYYTLADGIIALIGAARAGQRKQAWFLLAVEGSLGVVLGLFVLTRPASAFAIALLIAAVWALSTGIVELFQAGSLRGKVHGRGLLVASGLIRIAFGILLFARPGRGVMTLLWIAAAYALIDGVVLIALSLRLRSQAARGDDLGPRGMEPQPT